MPDILSAKVSTDLSSLPSRQNLLTTTTSPFLSTFTIDIVNLNLFYITKHSVILRNLTGTQSREFFFGDQRFLLEYISFSQNFAFSYLTKFLIITEMVLPFADVSSSHDQQFVDTERLGFEVTANSMFQESLQPFPGQFM